MFLATSDYFLKYLIGCAFFSSMITFLDIPHQAYCLVTKAKDWYFDLAYNYAISLSVFIIVLIYSTVAPILTIIGCCFFYIKVRKTIRSLTSFLVHG
jgi:hypothetical protein